MCVIDGFKKKTKKAFFEGRKYGSLQRKVCNLVASLRKGIGKVDLQSNLRACQPGVKLHEPLILMYYGCGVMSEEVGHGHMRCL